VWTESQAGPIISFFWPSWVRSWNWLDSTDDENVYLKASVLVA